MNPPEPHLPEVSVVIPAFNEAGYLPDHLPTVLDSLRTWEKDSGHQGEVIVVDNASTDDTAALATDLGARVVTEPVRGIGRARNTGAAAAHGRFLVFIDADVMFPIEGIADAVAAMDSGRSVGGAIPPHYAPTKRATRALFALWALFRRVKGGAQGVTQFCTRDAFAALGGYEAEMYMSEDVEFFARLTRYGRNVGRPVVYLSHLRVIPSPRRFETWPSWRMIWWTNPVVAQLAPRSRRFWNRWYDKTVR